MADRAWLNVGCGPFRAPEPWINTDVIRIDGNVEPDVVVEYGEPMPFADGTIDRVYLGHVLEHVEWPRVVPLLADVLRVLVAGGAVCVVGPDTNRTLQRWKNGDETWEQVLGVLEDDYHYQEVPADWDGARHAWNCYEDRVARALDGAGFVKIEALPITPAALGSWPLVAYTQHQCAVTAHKA